MIIADLDEDKSAAPITLELLTVGREIADKARGILCAAVLGNKVHSAAHEIARFSDEVYCVDDIGLATFQVDLYVDVLEQLCRSTEPEVLIIGHTQGNLELAPKLGYRMGSHLITDCIAIDVDRDGRHLACKKPIFGDNAVATFINDKKPRMATLRPSALEPAEQAKAEGKVIYFRPVLDRSAARTKLVETVQGERVSLDKADAVVAGGRGIGNVEDLEHLEKLAESLRKHFDTVEVGASRPLVDAGWLPPLRQIGLTGAKIRPQLYIAIGISGSLQHLAGVSGAKKIVAINSDPEASIFTFADFGVVGKYEDVLPALVAELKELQ